MNKYYNRAKCEFLLHPPSHSQRSQPSFEARILAVVNCCFLVSMSLLVSSGFVIQTRSQQIQQSPSPEYSSRRNEVSCVEIYTRLFTNPLATVNRQWKYPPADTWVKNVVHVHSRILVRQQKEQKEKHHMTSRICEISLKGETQRESCRLPGERNLGGVAQKVHSFR